MIPEIKHVLYATDLSRHARKAMAHAVGLANAYGAALTVIHVLEETSPNAEMLAAAFLDQTREEMVRKSRQDTIDEIKTGLNALCSELGCQLPACHFNLAEIRVEIGNPGDVLLELTKSKTFDILVMGRHDYGLIEEALIGHSAKKVLRRCPIPIFLVPIGTEGENEKNSPF